MLRSHHVAFVVCVMALAARSASAEEPRTAALEWSRGEGAESCVDVRTLARAVEARLGREVFVSPTRSELVIDARIARVGDVWHVRIVMNNAAGQTLGTRELDAAEAACTDATASIALVLSVMIDPEAELTEPQATPPEPTPAAAPTPAPPAAPVLPPTPPPRVEALEKPWLSLMAGASLSLGALPRGAGGMFVRTSMKISQRYRVALEGRFSPGVDTEAVNDRQATIARWSMIASVCPEWYRSPAISLRTCGGVELGAFESVGTGFDTNASRLDFLAAAIARAELGLHLSRGLTLSFAGTYGLSIIRHDFVGIATDDSAVPLWQTPAMFGSVELGLGLEFF